MEARRAERSTHPDATDLNFQGKARLYKAATAEHLTQARGFFERALAIDPRSVGALLGMAVVDFRMASALLADDRIACFSAAETKVIEALSLAPDHASAHSILGGVYVYTNRAAQGIAECEEALRLDHNAAYAHSFIGLAKYYMGRAAETEGHALDALRLSPRDTGAPGWMTCVGVAKIQLGADAEAAAWLRRSIEANRNFAFGHFGLAAALALLGTLDEARNAVKAGLVRDPEFTIRRVVATRLSDNPTYLAGRERICEGMRSAGVPER
jgi:tetratricopeptide (TPR) repeat protein